LSATLSECPQYFSALLNKSKYNNANDRDNERESAGVQFMMNVLQMPKPN